MFPDTFPKRGQLGIEVGGPEQTASRGCISEDVEVLGERVEGFGELIRAVSSGREIKTENDEGGMEGKGRQNVVLSHNSPFKRRPKLGVVMMQGAPRLGLSPLISQNCESRVTPGG